MSNVTKKHKVLAKNRKEKACYIAYCDKLILFPGFERTYTDVVNGKAMSFKSHRYGL